MCHRRLQLEVLRATHAQKLQAATESSQILSSASATEVSDLRKQLAEATARASKLAMELAAVRAARPVACAWLWPRSVACSVLRTDHTPSLTRVAHCGVAAWCCGVATRQAEGRVKSLTEELEVSKSLAARTLAEEKELAARQLAAAKEDLQRATASAAADKQAALEEARRQAAAEVRAATELSRQQLEEATKKLAAAEEAQTEACVP